MNANSGVRLLATLVALALGALALAGGATAKELRLGDLVLCGPSGCTRLDQGALDAIAGFMFSDNEGNGFDPGQAPPPPQPYRELRWTEGNGLVGAIVIDQQEVLLGHEPDRYGRGVWHLLPAQAAADLRQLMRDVTAFPAPTLRRVYLDARTAPDPAPYAAVFHPAPAVEAPSYKARRIHIGLTSAGPNAWLGRSSYLDLEYVPSVDALQTATGWVRVSPEFAALIERDAGLVRATHTSSGSGFPAAPVAGGLGALGFALAVAVGIAARRRRQKDGAG
jgi:hypothetical protein